MEWFTEEKYIDHAKMLVETGKQRNGSDGWVKTLTTTQIRNLLSLSAAIYDKAEALEAEDLNENIKSDLNYLRIQFVYQSGRTPAVKQFVEAASLNKLLEKQVNNKASVIRFCRYMESLVAYFKFEGGKDK